VASGPAAPDRSAAQGIIRSAAISPELDGAAEAGGGAADIQLVRTCLRARYDPSRLSAVRAAIGDDPSRWEAVRKRGAAERVDPLLHRALNPLQILPAAIAEALRRARRVTSLTNLLLLREFAGALRELTAAGVPVIVLKGAALAEAVYRDLSLRPMVDVDVLIRHDDVATAARVLGGLGYTPLRDETHPGALAEHENEMAFHKREGFPACIDVHWTLFDSPFHQAHVAMDWFWETAQPLRLAEMPTLMLGPEALLVHLCGHLALHHAATGLLWWHDIIEVLLARAAELDWPELLARTRAYELVLPVRAVLTRAQAEWGVPLPAHATAALMALPSSSAEERVFTRLSRPGRGAGGRFWIDLLAMTGWRQRLRFARTNLFPSAAYMRQRYAIAHPLLLPLYYPYRWLRGLLGAR
jgi:hypothetical protein